MTSTNSRTECRSSFVTMLLKLCWYTFAGDIKWKESGDNEKPAVDVAGTELTSFKLTLTGKYLHYDNLLYPYVKSKNDVHQNIFLFITYRARTDGEPAVNGVDESRNGYINVAFTGNEK